LRTRESDIEPDRVCGVEDPPLPRADRADPLPLHRYGYGGPPGLEGELVGEMQVQTGALRDLRGQRRLAGAGDAVHQDPIEHRWMLRRIGLVDNPISSARPVKTRVMTPKAPQDTMVRTTKDLYELWQSLMGSGGFGRRSVWMLFFDADGRPEPVI